MPKFIFVYHGGKAPEAPQEGEKVMAAWNAWYGGLGDAVVDGGGPCGPSSTVSTAGVSEGAADPISGLTQVNAESLEAAVEMAKGCPILADNGTVEVAEVMAM